MADHWFQSTGRFGLLKVIAPSFFDGFSRERWQTLIEHLKSNVMERLVIIFCRFLAIFRQTGHNFAGTPCRRRRQGARGAAALPTLEKFAKISHNWAENRHKVKQNFHKQWIFYRAAPPLSFIFPYACA